MKDFELKLPDTLAAAVGELPAAYSRDGAQVLAGGQDIVTVMKDDIEQPAALVSLQRLGLDGMKWDERGGLTIGATVTIQTLAEDARVEQVLPALREAARSVGSPQIRSQGTVGGNLNQRPRCPYYRHPSVSCFKKGGSVCLAEFGLNKYAAIFGGGPSYYSHPSDLATALVMLGATASITGPDGERQVPLTELYVLPEETLDTETVLRPDEILTSVSIPAPAADARASYLKYKERASYDFALAAVAVSVSRGDDGVVTDARVVLGGVAPKPWEVPAAARALVGKRMEPEAWTAAGEAAVADADPLEHNGYKVHLVKGLLFRALEALV
jgi:xanthine dehydrogenase YagS FAD-binding subunit